MSWPDSNQGPLRPRRIRYVQGKKPGTLKKFDLIMEQGTTFQLFMEQGTTRDESRWDESCEQSYLREKRPTFCFLEAETRRRRWASHHLRFENEWLWFKSNEKKTSTFWHKKMQTKPEIPGTKLTAPLKTFERAFRMLEKKSNFQKPPFCGN